MSQLIVVSVGTDHHPFDRLVTWSDHFAKSNTGVKVIVQYGTSCSPANAEGRNLIPHEELTQLFAEADGVVSHGGPSTVMDIRVMGKLPIVVARDPERGEHVDDHQIRFSEHLGKSDLAAVVHTEPEFYASLNRAITCPGDFVVAKSADGLAAGVLGFGEAMDSLLGVSTPIPIGPKKIPTELTN